MVKTHHKIIIGLVLFLTILVSVLYHNAAATSTWVSRTNSGSRPWYGIASSADGSKLAAVSAGGYIYTSTSYGETWVERTDGGVTGSYRIASSADGMKLITAGAYIYTSADGGATWTQRTSAGTNFWYNFDISDDGVHMIAAGDGIFTSDDSGDTWTRRTGPGGQWLGVAASSDGQNIVTTCNGCAIQTSTDGGVTWTPHPEPGTLSWRSFASSDDGVYLAAAVLGGSIWTSNDSGATWVNHGAAHGGNKNWLSITSSADGSHLAAGVYSNGGLWTSDDYGTTWNLQVDAGNRNWYGTAISADGTRIAAAVNSNYIYTFGPPNPPSLTTDPATLVTNTTATLGGNITNIGEDNPTERGMHYGLDDSYGSTSPSDSGSFSTGAFTENITGLTCDTLYHYQAFATNTAGTGVSDDATFSTNACNSTPTASLLSITGTLNYNQLLTGNYTYADTDGDLEGVSTFRWLNDDAPIDGATSFTYTTVVGDVGHNIKFEVTPVALTGVEVGDPVLSDGSIIVVATPTVTTDSASAVTKVSANLAGNITDTGGESNTVRGFEYGLTESYGDTVEESGTFSSGSFTHSLTHLVCNTTYHYRAFSTNSIGNGYGTDDTFKTTKCPQEIISVVGPAVTPPPVVTPIVPVVPVVPPKLTPVPFVKDVVKVPLVVKDEKTKKDSLVVKEESKSTPNTSSNSKNSSRSNSLSLSNTSNSYRNFINYIANNISDTFSVLGFSETRKVTKSIIETPAGEKIAQIAPAVGVVSGGVSVIAVSTVSGIFVNPLGVSELFLIPFRLWALLLTALGLKKKNRPWGTVYDSVTKQPLDPAYVVLKDMKGNEVATSITDLDGRYGFLVNPGTYIIQASKTNYEYPSKKMTGKLGDELYNDLYFSSPITITKEGEVIAKNIPLDPLKFDWNEFAKKKQNLMKFYSERSKWVARISNIFFAFGLIITMAAVLTVPTTYNIVTLVLYGILYILKNTALRPKPHGSITDKNTKNPLSFAIVRVFASSTKREVIHKVTNKLGQYYCLIPNGSYYITIEKKTPAGTYELVYTSNTIEVTDGYLKSDFGI